MLNTSASAVYPNVSGFRGQNVRLNQRRGSSHVHLEHDTSKFTMRGMSMLSPDEHHGFTANILSESQLQTHQITQSNLFDLLLQGDQDGEVSAETEEEEEENEDGERHPALTERVDSGVGESLDAVHSGAKTLMQNGGAPADIHRDNGTVKSLMTKDEGTIDSEDSTYITVQFPRRRKSVPAIPKNPTGRRFSHHDIIGQPRSLLSLSREHRDRASHAALNDLVRVSIPQSNKYAGTATLTSSTTSASQHASSGETIRYTREFLLQFRNYDVRPPGIVLVPGITDGRPFRGTQHRRRRPETTSPDAEPGQRASTSVTPVDSPSPVDFDSAHSENASETTSPLMTLQTEEQLATKPEETTSIETTVPYPIAATEPQTIKSLAPATITPASSPVAITKRVSHGYPSESSLTASAFNPTGIAEMLDSVMKKCQSNVNGTAEESSESSSSSTPLMGSASETLSHPQPTKTLLEPPSHQSEFDENIQEMLETTFQWEDEPSHSIPSSRSASPIHQVVVNLPKRSYASAASSHSSGNSVPFSSALSKSLGTSVGTRAQASETSIASSIKYSGSFYHREGSNVGLMDDEFSLMVQPTSTEKIVKITSEAEDDVAICADSAKENVTPVAIPVTNVPSMESTHSSLPITLRSREILATSRVEQHVQFDRDSTTSPVVFNGGYPGDRRASLPSSPDKNTMFGTSPITGLPRHPGLIQHNRQIQQYRRMSLPPMGNNSLQSYSMAASYTSEWTEDWSYNSPSDGMMMYQYARQRQGQQDERRGSVASTVYSYGMMEEQVVMMEQVPVKLAERSYYYGEDTEGVMCIPDRKWKVGVMNENYDSRHFTVMTYNVLAPFFATPEKFYNTKPEDLDWEVRKEKILDQMVYYAPDFICLQEVTPTDFKHYFLPHLRRLGYDGHFQSKKRGHLADGCAIFFQYSRFSLTALEAFAYSDQAKTIDGDEADIATRLSPFCNVAMICVFQHNRSRQQHNNQQHSKFIRLVNTHLHWDPEFSDTKLLQSALLLEWLSKTHADVPTIIASDLNSQWNEPVMEYLVKGRVDIKHFQGRNFGKYTTHEDVLYAPFRFTSAYQKGEVPFTNKAPEFTGHIDHILYTSDALSLKDVLLGLRTASGNNPNSRSVASPVDYNAAEEYRAPSSFEEASIAQSPVELPGSQECGSLVEGSALEAQENNAVKEFDYLQEVASFPSSVFPSDHIPLIACFKWKARPRGMYCKEPMNHNSRDHHHSIISPSNSSLGGSMQLSSSYPSGNMEMVDGGEGMDNLNLQLMYGRTRVRRRGRRRRSRYNKNALDLGDTNGLGLDGNESFMPGSMNNDVGLENMGGMGAGGYYEDGYQQSFPPLYSSWTEGYNGMQ